MGRNFCQFIAIEGQCALGAQGDGKIVGHLFDLFNGLVQVICLCPAHSLRFIAENKVQLVANNSRHALTKKLNHAGVGKAQGGLNTMGLGNFPGFHSGGQTRGGGHQIAFQIHIL